MHETVLANARREVPVRGEVVRTQIWRVPGSPRANSSVTGVEPKSEAMEKYAIVAVVKMTTAIW